MFLKNLWDERGGRGAGVDPLELLRYRSNLLGADLRITNFGGGNTSSKFELPDPLTGEPQRVMAVKGSGGDLRSIGAPRLRDPLSRQARSADRALSRRGARRRDGRRSIRCARSARTASPRRSTRRCTRSCRFRTSITCIPTGRSRSPRAPTASAKLEEFNRTYGRTIVWVPWQRPGLRAGADAASARSRRTRAATASSSAATACSRGATTQRECYLNSITTIDQMGEFIEEHARRAGPAAVRRRRRSPAPSPDREAAVADDPAVSARRRVVEPPRHRATSTARTTR